MITKGGDGTTATDDGSSAVLGPRRFEPGQLVSGRFRVVREIAQGGMAVVYEVRDEKLDERRALKCAKRGYARHLPPEARHCWCARCATRAVGAVPPKLGALDVRLGQSVRARHDARLGMMLPPQLNSAGGIRPRELCGRWLL